VASQFSAICTHQLSLRSCSVVWRFSEACTITMYLVVACKPLLILFNVIVTFHSIRRDSHVRHMGERSKNICLCHRTRLCVSYCQHSQLNLLMFKECHALNSSLIVLYHNAYLLSISTTNNGMRTTIKAHVERR
jgi:hypothetical protein